jgi:hypothetical protein
MNIMDNRHNRILINGELIEIYSYDPLLSKLEECKSEIYCET